MIGALILLSLDLSYGTQPIKSGSPTIRFVLGTSNSQMSTYVKQMILYGFYFIDIACVVPRIITRSADATRSAAFCVEP